MLLWAQAGDPAPRAAPPRPVSRTFLYAAIADEPRPVARQAFLPPPPSLLRRGSKAAGKAVVLMAVVVTALVTPTGQTLPHLEHRLPWEGDAASQDPDLFLPENLQDAQLQLASVQSDVDAASDATGTTALTGATAFSRPDLPAIPAPVLAAYHGATAELALVDPACGLPWQVLAGIGAVESRHAQSGGSLNAGWSGVAAPPILGPRLDGSAPGTARIADTDSGRLDGDAEVDRAVGPMQFLPGTWAAYGSGDPQDVRAAALAAARYLCAGSYDLRDPTQLWSAVHRYNRSSSYVRKVMALSSAYLGAALGSGPQAVSAAAIAFAYARLGDPYLWGGTGPLYDCSGLTQAAFRSAGVAIPRTAAEQWVGLPAVSAEDLQVGDLVFFQLGARIENMPGHVAIYLGNGRTVEAPFTGATVRLGTVAHSGPLVGVRRPAAPAPDGTSPLGEPFLAAEQVAPPTPSIGPSPSPSPVTSPSPDLVPPAVEEAPTPVPGSLPSGPAPTPSGSTTPGPEPFPGASLLPEPTVAAQPTTSPDASAEPVVATPVAATAGAQPTPTS